jgi:hypothetical protein
MPIRQKPKMMNPKLKPLVKLELEKIEKVGIIFFIRHSELIFNLVVVRKKNGIIHLCVDFRDLNKASLKENYPLPNMESLLQQVTGSKLKSMLDGFSSYNQILVPEEDQYKIAFTAPWGMHVYNQIPFGLKNVGATFQRVMDNVFKDLIVKIMANY